MKKFSSRAYPLQAFKCLFDPLPRIRMRGEAGSEEVFARNLATLKAKLDGYEVILSKQKYLAGDVSGPSALELDR